MKGNKIILTSPSISKIKVFNKIAEIGLRRYYIHALK